MTACRVRPGGCYSCVCMCVFIPRCLHWAACECFHDSLKPLRCHTDEPPHSPSVRAVTMSVWHWRGSSHLFYTIHFITQDSAAFIKCTPSLCSQSRHLTQAWAFDHSLWPIPRRPKLSGECQKRCVASCLPSAHTQNKSERFLTTTW